MSEPRGSVAELEQPCEADDGIPAAGRDAGAIALCVSGSGPRRRSEPPHPVEPVLYLPAASAEGKDAFRGILNARHPARRFPPLMKKVRRFGREDRPAVREAGISLEILARPYLSVSRAFPCTLSVCAQGAEASIRRASMPPRRVSWLTVKQQRAFLSSTPARTRVIPFVLVSTSVRPMTAPSVRTTAARRWTFLSPEAPQGLAVKGNGLGRGEHAR